MVVVLKCGKPKNIVRLEGDKPITAAVTASHAGRDFHGMVALSAACGVVLVCGEPDVKARINEWTDSLLPASVPQHATLPNRANRSASPAAQHDYPGSAGGSERRNTLRSVRVQLVDRVGYGVFLGHISTAILLRCAARGASGRSTSNHVQAALSPDGDDCVDARPCLRDELLGHDVDARTFSRHHGCRVSVLQRGSRVGLASS